MHPRSERCDVKSPMGTGVAIKYVGELATHASRAYFGILCARRTQQRGEPTPDETVAQPWPSSSAAPAYMHMHIHSRGARRAARDHPRPARETTAPTHTTKCVACRCRVCSCELRTKRKRRGRGATRRVVRWSFAVRSRLASLTLLAVVGGTSHVDYNTTILDDGESISRIRCVP